MFRVYKISRKKKNHKLVILDTRSKFRVYEISKTGEGEKKS